MDHYTQATSSFRNILLTALEPIEKIAWIPKDTYNWISQDFATLNELTTENNRLETENLLLKSELQQLNNLKTEILQLTRLLGTVSRHSQDTSKVISVTNHSITPTSHFITLNKGSNANLRTNLPVIGSSGIIGKIINTTPFSSRVLLITDSSSQVPVRIQRTGKRGILTGTGTEKLSLQFVTNSSSVIVGDIIETTGLGNLYPKGRPVAKVTSVTNRKDQPFYKINATATADLNTLTKVIVLYKKENHYDK